MLARERHEQIVAIVRGTGSVRVRDLADRFDVSEMTVRRDLDALASQGLIDKVHGGATRSGNLTAFEPGFAAKLELKPSEKLAIATAAARLVEPNSAIGLTAGTTTWTMANELVTASPALTGITTVTNSPSVAHVLYGALDVSVVLTGGVRTPSDALVGPVAVSSIESLRIDTLFMGVHGIDASAGFTTPNLSEAEVNRALVNAARRVVVLADHTKWGTVGLARIMPLDRADVIISDDGLHEDARNAIHGAGVDLIIAVPSSTA